MEAFHQATADYVANMSSAERAAAEIIYIPVVVHVVYNTAVQNISDEQIQSQIDVLNEDFRRMNDDAVDTRSQFAAIVADSEIQFCLADLDPNGNATDGITRTMTSEISFDQSDPGGWDNVKQTSAGGIDGWPRDNYLNMWVCNLDPTAGVLGYAYPPPTFPAWRDGVVIHFRYFGRIGAVFAPYNKGRTTTHEVGHWLGLRHIWGDGACGVDDGIGDTPLQDGWNFGCPTSSPPSTCGSLDMYENYMDYVDDACMNAFTQGQVDFMRNVLATDRSTIPSSSGCYFNTAVDDDIIPSEEINVIPNPATGSTVQLVLDRPVSDALEIQLYNQLGQPVIFRNQCPGFERSTVCLNIENLPSGLYFVHVNDEGIKGSGKFIITH